jgi:hypothetical protein
MKKDEAEQKKGKRTVNKVQYREYAMKPYRGFQKRRRLSSDLGIVGTMVTR